MPKVIPTWTHRVIRAFGANPTDRLVRVRNGKVETALQEANKYIQRLSGRDKSSLQGRYDNIEEDRLAAMGQGSNSQKCEALDPVKTAARQLAKDSLDTYNNRRKGITAKTEEEWQETKEYLDEFKKGYNVPEMVSFYGQKITDIKVEIDNLKSIESFVDLQRATDGIYKIDGTGTLFALSEEVYLAVSKEKSFIPIREKINNALNRVQLILDSYKFDILTNAKSKLESVIEARNEAEKIDPLKKGSGPERIKAYEIGRAHV